MAEPWYRTQALALLDPDPGQPAARAHEIETMPPDARDEIFAPYPLATATKSARASKPKPMPASSKPVASPATKPTVTSAATPTGFSAPDISDLVLPGAALSVMTLSVAELARSNSSTAHWTAPTNGAALSSASARPIGSAMKLPGPFHVFFTTGRADDMTAMGASGNGTADGAGTGAGTGTGGLVGSAVGTVGGTVGSTVGTVGSTVGAVGTTVGSTVGGALGLLKR